MHRRRRVPAVLCLDVGLLVGRQDDSVRWRREIKTADVGRSLPELWSIASRQPALDLVRTNIVYSEDAADL